MYKIRLDNSTPLYINKSEINKIKTPTKASLSSKINCY